MSYCLNPACKKTENVPQAPTCQACGAALLLRDRYRATKVLGHGGFGTTFLAKDEGLPGHPDCVIKQLRPASNTPKFIEQCQKLFQREAETLGKIGNHPQITRLLDYFALDQEFYLVQEYIEGSTLDQETRKAGPYTESQGRELLQELLPVLDYLHGQKVIHRDIKPANIIRRAIDGKLILIDFGVVKDQVSQTVMAQTPENGAFTNIVVGTHGFAPPEQMSRRPVYASDIYSLGMTCLALIQGGVPEDSDYDPTTGELNWQSNVQISDSFRVVLSKMLEASVRDRYQSAKDVLTALESPNPVSQAPKTSPAPQTPPAQSKAPADSSLAKGMAASPARDRSNIPISVSAPPQFVSDQELGPIIKAKKDRPWWNRPLIGNRSFTERVIYLFKKLPIAERALFLHQQSLEKATALINKAQTIDSEKFGSKDFTAFVRIQYALGKGDADYASLTQSAELLRIGIKAKHAYLKIEQVELSYRGSKQLSFYTFVQDLLAQKADQEQFRQQVRSQLETTLPQIKSDEGKAALQTYVEQLEALSEHELGLRLLSLFKEYQLSDYSILRIVSELVNSLTRMEVFDLKALVTQVVAQYEVFEKLGRIIGVPEHRESPETYARLLQYLALSEKYQTAYPKFQQLVALLRQWQPHHDAIIAIRQQYNTNEYKRPKTFKQAIPGTELFDKYRGYLEQTEAA